MIMMPSAINHLDLATDHGVIQPICAYQAVAQTQCGFPPIAVPSRRCDSALTTEPSNDRTAHLALLDRLALLTANWDGYGAEPIDPRCVANARNLLCALRPGIPSPELTPNPNGTLTLDWTTEDQALSLELGITRFSGFWESRAGTKMGEGMLEAAVPAFALQALDALFPAPAWGWSIYAGLLIDASGHYGLATPVSNG